MITINQSPITILFQLDLDIVYKYILKKSFNVQQYPI